MSGESEKSIAVKMANDEMFGAVVRRREDALKAALDAGADVDAKDVNGRGVLIMAAWRGNAECLRALLGAGADLESRGGNGWTPLMWAARCGHARCVEVLLGAGAAVEAADAGGLTALMHAASGGNEACVRVLLGAGGDPTEKSADGRGAMDFCSEDSEFGPEFSECLRMLAAAEAWALARVVGKAGLGARKASL